MSEHNNGSNKVQEHELLQQLNYEKRMRLIAEEKLAQQSSELQLANQHLQQALDESEQRRQELAFLLHSSGSIKFPDNNENLLTQTTFLSANYVKSSFAVCSVQLQHNTAFSGYTPIYTHHDLWRERPDVIDSINAIVAQHSLSTDNNEWFNSPIEIDAQPYYLMVKRLPIDKESHIQTAFVVEKLPKNKDVFNVLNIMQSQLSNLLLARKLGSTSGINEDDVEVVRQQLERARVQLEQSEKMASLGQLAAGIAHEINNPVGFVRSNLEVMKGYLASLQAMTTELNDIDDPAIKRLLDAYDANYLVDDSADIIDTNLAGMDRIAEIVAGLKIFSHHGEGQFEKVDVADVVQIALSVSHNELKYKHQVVNNIVNNTHFISGRAGQIQQVLINILVNAAHAMEDGGCVELSSERHADKIYLVVTDNGCGIEDDVMEHLFEPFFTTKGVGKGSGLGLSISYRIIENHGGEIQVSSVVGQGTTFTIILPQYEEDFDRESNTDVSAQFKDTFDDFQEE